MAIEDVHETSEPYDRLTKLCDTMQKSIDTPENDDVKGIVFLHDEDRGGIVMFGYKDTTTALADLLVHMKAMFQSQGKSFGVMTDQGVMIMDEQ